MKLNNGMKHIGKTPDGHDLYLHDNGNMYYYEKTGVCSCLNNGGIMCWFNNHCRIEESAFNGLPPSETCPDGIYHLYKQKSDWTAQTNESARKHTGIDPARN